MKIFVASVCGDSSLFSAHFVFTQLCLPEENLEVRIYRIMLCFAGTGQVLELTYAHPKYPS